MDSLKFVILLIIQQISLAGGAVVNLTFADKGYIGQSIHFQCKTDAPHITSPSAIWYFKGSIFSSSSSRFSEIPISDGFNLIISNLTTADEGDYACGIDFDTSAHKTLGIVYNTQSKDITIQRDPSAGTISITITAYPDPTYTVTVTEVQNGLATPVTNVNWTSVKTTQANNVIIRRLTANNFTKDTYNITGTVTSTWPFPIIVHGMVSFEGLMEDTDGDLESSEGSQLNQDRSYVWTMHKPRAFTMQQYNYCYNKTLLSKGFKDSCENETDRDRERLLT